MGRVTDFFNNVVKQGLSYNNEYSFSFEQVEGSTPNGDAFYRLNESGFGDIFSNESNTSYLSVTRYPGDKMRVLCEEISLPGVSSATGNARGIYQGVDFKYAHTKIYNDLSISFICDKDLTPLRFFQIWHSWIYESGNNSDSNKISYTTKYYYDYCLNMFIQKNETKYAKQKQIVYYKLINAFPTSISSTPLNGGASSVTRVTINLSYERWVFKTAPGVSNSGGNLAPSVWTS